MASPYLDLALRDDARPALEILLDERCERLRVAPVNLDAELCEAFLHLRICEGFHGRIAKLLDDAGIHARGSHQAAYVEDLELLKAELREGRRVGQARPALEGGNGQRPDGAALDLRYCCARL